MVVEEQFGPTVPILYFDNEEHIIQLHNNCSLNDLEDRLNKKKMSEQL